MFINGDVFRNVCKRIVLCIFVLCLFRLLLNYSFSAMNGTPAYQCGYRLDDSFDDSLLNDWEDSWMDILASITNDLNIDNEVTISYNAHKSFNDELTRAVASDVVSFSIAFSVLAIFASMLVARFKRRNLDAVNWCKCIKYAIDRKRSRSAMATFGIWSSLLATGAAFGIVGGILGIKYNSVVSVSPFLLVGLGGVCVLTLCFVLLLLVFIWFGFGSVLCPLSYLMMCLDYL